MGKIVAVFRYPLKSASGESLSDIAISDSGVDGDRLWACVDETDGTVVSRKHPRRWAGMCAVSASGAPETAIQIGDREFAAGSPEADTALSAHLDRPVRLTRTVPADARLHRLLPTEPGMVPDWLTAGPDEELVTAIAGARNSRFVDFGAVHLVTTGALAMLAAQTGRESFAPTAFRPNLVLDAPADPEPGTELRIGDVLLRVQLPTPRCVVPALDAGGRPTDRELLTALARHHRAELPGLGRAACFGVYAQVLNPGQISLGQQASVGGA